MNYIRILTLLLFVSLHNARANNITSNQGLGVEYESPKMIFSLLVILTAGSVVRLVLSHIPYVPYQLGLNVLGFFIGWFTNKYQEVDDFFQETFIHPRLLLFLFLPALNFRTAYTMDGHTFFKIFWQIIFVGIPGLLLSSLITGSMLMVFFDIYKGNWVRAFMFATITSTTFCHDVVILLRDLENTKPLVTLLEGENLIGDATALMVFYTIISGEHINDISSVFKQLQFLVAYWFGGALYGWLFGQIAFILCQRVLTDATRKTMVILSLTYAIFFTSEEILYISGVAAVTFLGIAVGSMKNVFDEQMENTLKHMWESVCHLAETFIFVIIGIMVVHNAISVISYTDVIRTVITYVVCNTSRAVVYVVLLPAMKRVGYGMDFRDAIIAVLGSQYGVLSVICSLMVLRLKDHSQEGISFAIDITIMMTLHFVINGLLARQFLRMLGFLDVSQEKKANMGYIIHLLGEAQRRVLGALIYEKFLAGAKWKTVEEATRIRNPYALQQEDDADDEFLRGANQLAACPECREQSLLAKPTAEELEEMSREAQLRLLKVKIASYRRQFERGMLSSSAANVLVAAANDAMNKREIFVDVDKLTAAWELRPFFKRLSSVLAKLKSFTDGYPCGLQHSEQRWKKFVVKIATHKLFTVLIYLVIFVHTALVILQISLRPKPASAINIIFASINSAFFVVYFMEFVIKVIACGFIQLMKCHWIKMNVLLILISATDVSVDYANNFMKPFNATIAIVAWIFLFLRFLRSFRLLWVAISACSMLIDDYINKKLCRAFELQKCFINGEEEVLEIMKQMVYHKEIADTIKSKLENNRLAMEKKIGAIRRETPDVGITVYTRQAISSTLKHLKEAIQKLNAKGIIDEMEYTQLISLKEMRLAYLKTNFEMVAMTDYPTLLRAVPWILGDEELAKNIEVQGEIKGFTYAETILQPGPTEKVYIILFGTIKIRYEPSESSIRNLENFGAVPNIDYFNCLKFDVPQENAVSAGNVIGELSLLTNGIYDATVTCDGPVEVLMVPKDVIQITSDLEEHIWKSVAGRIALLILQSVPTYVAWNIETLFTHLERGFVQKLQNIKKFIKTNMVKDVLLINGSTRDETSGEIFFGPTYIPRTVHRLKLHNPSSLNVTIPVPSILFIIPEDGFEEDEVMRQTSDVSVRRFQTSRYRRNLFSSRNVTKMHEERSSNTASLMESNSSTTLSQEEEPLPYM